MSAELVESVMSSTVTVWYGEITVEERKALQREMNNKKLPSVADIYTEGPTT